MLLSVAVLNRRQFGVLSLWPALTFAVPAWAVPGNIVLNGSFEDYSYEAWPIWKMRGGNIRPDVAAPDGSTILGAGYISQDLVTVPGQEYELRFAYGGTAWLAKPHPLIILWDNDVFMALETTTQMHLWEPVDYVWTYYTFHVTARHPVTRLQFRNYTDGYLWSGLHFIDDVSVVPVERRGNPATPSLVPNLTNVEMFENEFRFVPAIYNAATWPNHIALILRSSNPELLSNDCFGFSDLRDAGQNVVTFRMAPEKNMTGNATVTVAINDGTKSTTGNINVRVYREPPSIAPKSPLLTAGGTAAFEIEPGARQLAGIQWQFNGVPIADATNTHLQVPSGRPELQGLYTAVVTNQDGAVEKCRPATLMLTEPGGTVLFANRVVPEIDAPIYGEDGVTKLAGDRYFAQLYAGERSDILVPIGPACTFKEGMAAGYLDLGSSDRTISWAQPGQPVFAEIRVWEAGLGSTFEETRAHGGAHGRSDPLLITVGGFGVPPQLPTPLSGLRSFKLTRSRVQAASFKRLTFRRVGLTLERHQIHFEAGPESRGIFTIQKSGDLRSWSDVAVGISVDSDFAYSRFRSSSAQEILPLTFTRRTLAHIAFAQHLERIKGIPPANASAPERTNH